MDPIGQWFNFIANRNKGITYEEVFRRMKAIDAKSGIAGYKPNYLFGEKISLDGEVLPPLIPDVDTLSRFVAITDSIEDPMTQKEKEQSLLKELSEKRNGHKM